MDFFKKAVPIWLDQQARPDEFAEFAGEFTMDDPGKAELYIAADSDWTAYVNGKLAGFGQYPGYPEKRCVERLNLTGLAGRNTLLIRVWYYGAGSQTYAVGEAGVCFEVRKGDEVLCASAESTLSRLSSLYVSHREEMITTQLGFTWHVDAEAIENEYAASRRIPWNTEYEFRPIPKLCLGERTPVVWTGAGSWTERGGRRNSDIMQNAALSRIFPGKSGPLTEPREICGEGSGVWFIVDLSGESVGFFDLDVETESPCDMLIGWGEHLSDGRCRTSVRNFAAEIRLPGGRFRFTDTFRRMGCRYIQFFVRAPKVRVYYAGLRPVEYPVEEFPFEAGNLLQREIYRVSVNTLRCCMHDHYEDCPWREQALYTMDSRNQMLCGYYAFHETRMPRASLETISRSRRPDGFLSICAPDHGKIVIPFFNLVYFLQMREYLEYTGDVDFIREKMPLLETLLAGFEKRIGPDGLCVNPVGEGLGYWNFTEWSDTLSGTFNDVEPHTDSILNASLILALRDMARMKKVLGLPCEKENRLADSLRKALHDVFFRKEDGLFSTSLGRFENTRSTLVQTLCLLSGAAEGEDLTRMLEVIEKNGAGIAIPATLSMNCFRYDALLAADAQRYVPSILNEIDTSYLGMLKCGATSFWETLDGDPAFSDAGSLCHGWSALPVFYYETLIAGKDLRVLPIK